MTLLDLNALLPLAPCDPAEGRRRLILEEVIAELLAQKKLTHFAAVAETAGFVAAVAGMIDELTLAGIRPAAFAREVLRRGAQPRPAHVECARLYARYRKALHRHGLGDSFDRERAAAEWILTGEHPTLLSVQQLTIEGNIDWTAGRLAILQALLQVVPRVRVRVQSQGDDRAELFAASNEARSMLSAFADLQLLTAETDTEPSQDAATLQRPAGLLHLRRQLFRPLRKIEPSANANGIEQILAPGVVGEARLVARRIRELLEQGVAAEEIVVVPCDLDAYADLLADTFAEYAIATTIEGTTPLARQPAVALLLRAARLIDEDFPFAGVTALLRHGLFRPEFADSPEKQLQAEALLRLLGEPRGRDAYLSLIERWAKQQLPGLEDEAAEESRRRRIHELAQVCEGFLRRFFGMWDDAPMTDPLRDHLAWVARFARRLGLGEAPWQTHLDEWRDKDGETLMDRRTFLRRWFALMHAVGVPRSTSTQGVRVFSLESASGQQPRVLFMLGLGERSLPRAVVRESLLDESDRERFGISTAAHRLSREMQLFYRLLAAPSERLILSYAAIDSKGQELLPGSFLIAVQDCFTSGAIPTQRRTMLLDHRPEDRAFSAAELRVDVARQWPWGSEKLPETVRANLYDAAGLIDARFRRPEFTPYDGQLTDRFITEWNARLFSPAKVYSPTAIEDYIACPFRFFLKQVLHLDPLEEPTEEIEVTRRGMTYHRALARLHQRLKNDRVHTPTPEVEERMVSEMTTAINEDIDRAHGGAARELWRLEGERLLRTARRYPAHWEKFQAPWRERGITPQPTFFEVDFGLPPAPESSQPSFQSLELRHEDITLKIWGRIDRVDLAQFGDEVGFWIIDYKTGRSANYTATDLAEFRKVQLTLYAIAVETVLLHGRKARPLGLAYWLVGEQGPKVVLPGRSATLWMAEIERWPKLREQLLGWVSELVRNIRQGRYPLAPRSEHCQQMCPYSRICRISQARNVGKPQPLPLPNDRAG
jgi:ATP-dependent helicase/DNAse subunit B